jgi:hypothetical protein
MHQVAQAVETNGMRIEREHGRMARRASRISPRLYSKIELGGRELGAGKDFETPAAADEAEGRPRFKLGEVQLVEVGAKTKIRFGAVIGEARIGWDLDYREGPHEIEVASRHGMIGKALQGEGCGQKLGGVRHACCRISTPAFDRNRRANRGERRRLHAQRPREVHDRSAEQSGQMEMGFLETADAGVVRVGPELL